jgi:hypothetical protein
VYTLFTCKKEDGKLILAEERTRKLALPFLKGVWIYCLILWSYIVADMFVFPQYQFGGISKLIPIPQNLIADIAFPISFVAFVLWEYLRKIDSSELANSDPTNEGRRNASQISR